MDVKLTLSKSPNGSWWEDSWLEMLVKFKLLTFLLNAIFYLDISLKVMMSPSQSFVDLCQVG